MIPYVPKQSVTIIAVSDVLEATAVRAALEGFNYRPTTHWVGSRAESGAVRQWWSAGRRAIRMAELPPR
jgi:hypothetical protein